MEDFSQPSWVRGMEESKFPQRTNWIPKQDKFGKFEPYYRIEYEQWFSTAAEQKKENTYIASSLSLPTFNSNLE